MSDLDPPEHTGTLLSNGVHSAIDFPLGRRDGPVSSEEGPLDEQASGNCNKFPFMFTNQSNISYFSSAENEKLKRLKEKKQKHQVKQKNKFKDIYQTKGPDEYNIEKALEDLGENGVKDKGNKKGSKKTKVNPAAKTNGVVKPNRKQSKEKDTKREDESNSSSDEEVVVPRVAKKTFSSPVTFKAVDHPNNTLVSEKMKEMEELNGDRQLSKSTDDLSFTTVTKKKWKKKSPDEVVTVASSGSSSSSSSRNISESSRRSAAYNLRSSRNEPSQNSSRSSSISHSSTFSSKPAVSSAAANHLDLATDFPPLGPEDATQGESFSSSSSTSSSSTPSSSAVTSSKTTNKTSFSSVTQQQQQQASSVWSRCSSDPQAVISDKNNAILDNSSQFIGPSSDPHVSQTVANSTKDYPSYNGSTCSTANSSGANTPPDLKTNVVEEPVVILAADIREQEWTEGSSQGIEFGFDLNGGLLSSCPADATTKVMNPSAQLLDDDAAIVSFGSKGESLTSSSGRGTPVMSKMCPQLSQVMQGLKASTEEEETKKVNEIVYDQANFVKLVSFIATRWKIAKNDVSEKKPNVLYFDGKRQKKAVRA